jgi:hypothetical protein
MRKTTKLAVRSRGSVDDKGSVVDVMYAFLFMGFSRPPNTRLFVLQPSSHAVFLDEIKMIGRCF